MSERKMKRQGDLFFIPVGDVRIRNEYIRHGIERHDHERGGYILARGEKTGHAHVAVADPESDTRVVPHYAVETLQDDLSGLDDNTKLAFIVAPDGTRIEHEQHPDEILEEGNWLVMQQRQHNPDDERRPIPRRHFD